MSLTSPKSITSLLLQVDVAVVAVSGLPVAEPFATVMLELDAASLSLTQAVVMPAAEVDSTLLVESAVAVANLLVAKPPGELVALTTLAVQSVVLVDLLAVVSAVLAFVKPEVASSAAKPPGELVAFSTAVAPVDRLVSNVAAALVAFVPLAVVQSTLEAATLVAVHSVASLATSASEDTDMDITVTATDTVTAPPATDTTRDGEYKMTKCPRTFFWKGIKIMFTFVH